MGRRKERDSQKDKKSDKKVSKQNVRPQEGHGGGGEEGKRRRGRGIYLSHQPDGKRKRGGSAQKGGLQFAPRGKKKKGGAAACHEGGAAAFGVVKFSPVTEGNERGGGVSHFHIGQTEGENLRFDDLCHPRGGEKKKKKKKKKEPCWITGGGKTPANLAAGKGKKKVAFSR